MAFQSQRIGVGAALLVAACTAEVGGLGGTSDDEGPPAESPLLRLTARQYENAVRTAFPTLGELPTLPPDGEAHGFTHNADSFADEGAVRAYARAAEAIADAVTADVNALLAPCVPAQQGEEQCAQELLARVAPALYRAPLSLAERDALVEQVFRPARQASTLKGALTACVELLLQSPRFLYQLEAPQQPAPGEQTYALSGRELAVRLAHLLWQGPPDAALSARAERGELDTPEALAEEARRLLADERARGVLRQFVAELLELRHLEGASRRPDLYPMFDANLAKAMRRETELLTDEVLWSGRGKLGGLFRADFTYVDSALAPLYGLSAPADGSFHRVQLPAGQKRGGVLGLSAFLTSQATSAAGSPIRRGLVVRDRLLCDPPPPPPPGAATGEVNSRLTAPACAGCHTRFENIGDGLAEYDAVGRHQVGPSPGSIFGTADADGPFSGAAELGERLSASAQVRDCVAKQWTQALTGHDAPKVTQALAAALDASDGDVREALVAFVQTRAFRSRTDHFPDACEVTP